VSPNPPPRPLFAHILTLRHKVTGRPIAGLAAGAALLAAAAVVVAAIPPGADAPSSPAPLPVATLAVEVVSSHTVTRTYTGRVRARRSSALGFERTGRLVAVEVADGARVAAGDALARLDTRRLDARRRDLAARLDGARARLDELRAGPRVETIDATRARVVALEEDLELLRLKRRRREQLVAGDVLPQERLDEAATAVAAAAARLEAARRELDELEAGTRAEQVRAQEALVEQLTASLAGVDVDLADSVLRAPYAGVVGEVLADPGTVLAPGQPVARLVEAGALEAWVGVPADRAGALVPGADLEVRVGGAARPAVVRGVLPEVDPRTRTATVVLDLARAPAAPTLRTEQIVRLELAERRSVAGIWLPLAALSKGELDMWSALAVVPDPAGEGLRLERRRVSILEVAGERVLVRGDLAAGERVVAGGTHRVVPGQAVRIAEPVRPE